MKVFPLPPEADQPPAFAPGVTHALWIVRHFFPFFSVALGSDLSELLRSFDGPGSQRYLSCRSQSPSSARPAFSINTIVAATIAGRAHQTPKPISQITSGTPAE